MGFRHTPFFELLDAVQAGGCPLCRIVNRAVRRYLEATLYEFVNDAGMRRRVVQSQGFCAAHAALLRQMGDGLGVVLLHEQVLAGLSRGDLAAVLKAPAAPCPACATAAEWLDHSGGTLLASLDEPEITDYLNGQPALCLSHLRWLARHSRSRQQRKQFAELARKTAEHLYTGALTFANAANGSDPNRPDLTPEEKTVWLRILDFLSGSPA